MVQNSRKVRVITISKTCSVRWFLYLRPMDTNTAVEDKRVVTLELPGTVVDQLKARARRNQRSLSGELRFVLINSLERVEEAEAE